MHWLTFYAAIKASNASITLVCLATATFFTALIEPFVMKQKVSMIELGLGLAILPGMILIVNSTNGQYTWGIFLGITSAVLAATFGALNKRYLGSQDPISITLIEMVAATLLLSLCLPFILSSSENVSLWPSQVDWIYLIVLALLCTNVAYLLALRALRHLSAYTTALTINLEPLYGIILAAILLGQHHDLNIRFYFGATIILLAVIGYPLLKKIVRNKSKPVVE
jgi:drug/metabolite transporter (DMT)-like permease